MVPHLHPECPKQPRAVSPGRVRGARMIRAGTGRGLGWAVLWLSPAHQTVSSAPPGTLAVSSHLVPPTRAGTSPRQAGCRHGRRERQGAWTPQQCSLVWVFLQAVRHGPYPWASDPTQHCAPKGHGWRGRGALAGRSWSPWGVRGTVPCREQQPRLCLADFTWYHSAWTPQQTFPPPIWAPCRQGTEGGAGRGNVSKHVEVCLCVCVCTPVYVHVPA